MLHHYMDYHSTTIYRYQNTGTSNWILFFNRYDFSGDDLYWQVEMSEIAEEENVHSSVLNSETFMFCGQTEDKD